MMDIWSDKYRAKSSDSYVWSNPKLKAKAEEWIAARRTPNLLFSGKAGTGKTSLAWLLCRLMGIPKEDILFINASGEERKVDNLVRDVTSFASTWANNDTDIKYVILDEADRLSQNAQDALKAIIEQNMDSVRFILTANNRTRIIDPLHSRLEEYIFNALDLPQAANIIMHVLETEKVSYEPEILVKYLNISYPDLRKCIGLLQKNTVDGVLTDSDDDASVPEYMETVLTLVREGSPTSIRKARALVVENARVDDFPSIYTFLYQNIEQLTDDLTKQDDALLMIRDGMVKHPGSFDPEINLAATLVCLSRL